MASSPERVSPAAENLTPLVRQLASQLRATRSGSAIVRSFPERDAASRPDLRPTLDAVKRASEQNQARQEAISLLRQRLEEAEARLAAQSQQLAESESRLRGATDEARRQRGRADELERRSTELLDKTQEMLTDAGQRLQAAEARSEGAESDLAYLKDFIRDRLGA